MILYFYSSPHNEKWKCCAHAAVEALKGQEFWQEEEEETMFTEKNSTPAVSFCKSGMGKRQQIMCGCFFFLFVCFGIWAFLFLVGGCFVLTP